MVDRPEAALPYRQQLFASHPTLGRGRALARAYCRGGFKEDALSIIDLLRQLGGNSTAVLRTIYDLLKDWEMETECLAVLHELTRRVPDDSHLFVAIGDLHWNAGRREEAAEAYRQSLAMRPGQIGLVRRLRFLDSQSSASSVSPPFYPN